MCSHHFHHTPSTKADPTLNQARSFAAVIFRRIASKTRRIESGENIELFLSIPQEQAYAIRERLLNVLGIEGTNTVRNKIGDAVAEIAREYSDNGL
jgi:hypothetical protein